MAETNCTVEYRTVPGFPGYRAGDDGSIWSCWGNTGWGEHGLTNVWKRVSTPPGAKGYLRCNMVNDGRIKSVRIHRVILEAFVGPCPEGMECRHLNGIRTDNRLVNLAWGTRKENIDDKVKHANHGPRIKLYTHNGKTLSVKAWSRELNIPYLCLYQRIRVLGMTFEEAISRPYAGVSSNGNHWTMAKRRRSTQQSPSI